MTYQVVWLPSALDELGLATSDRASVTMASQRIDARLATSPLLGASPEIAKPSESRSNPRFRFWTLFLRTLGRYG